MTKTNTELTTATAEIKKEKVERVPEAVAEGENDVRITPLISKEQKMWLDSISYQSKIDGNFKSISSIIRDLIDCAMDVKQSEAGAHHRYAVFVKSGDQELGIASFANAVHAKSYCNLVTSPVNGAFVVDTED